MRLILIPLVLALLAAPVGAASGVQVYLADGGIITGQKIWRSGGTIFVLVNRDTLLEFAPREVLLQKSFSHKSRHANKKRRCSPYAG